MELKDYTDEELRSEIRRRANEKRKITKANNKIEPYLYADAVVESCDRFGTRMYEKEYRFGYGKIDPNRPYDDRATLSTNCGFKKNNIPQVGDLVRLRKRNHVDKKKNVFSPWKICEVLKRK